MQWVLTCCTMEKPLMKLWKSQLLGVLIGAALVGASCGDRPVKSPPADPHEEVGVSKMLKDEAV